MAAPELRISPDPPALYRAAAEAFARQATEAVAARGRFTVALAGGSTPRGLYALLAGDPVLSKAVPWEAIHFFWGDERTVAPDHVDSNYRMAAEVLLSRVTIAPANVHRIRGEAAQPEAAAMEYEAELRAFFASAADGPPVLDLILLGLGSDAHTASLFPGTAALGEQFRWVVANRVNGRGTTRITLTLPVINRARCVLFLVSGAGKAPAVWATLLGPREPRRWPAQAIEPSMGRCLWMLDAEAASMLGGGAGA